MKNKFTRITRLLMMLMLVFALVVPCEAQAASTPKISKTSVTLTHAKGKCTYNLNVSNVPSGGKVTWSSSNKKIARVAKVKVTSTTSTYKVISVAKGSAYVYAKVYNKKGKLVKTLKCKVISKKNHKYTSSVTKEATTVSKGTRTYTCSCGAGYKVTIPMLEAAEEVADSVDTNNGCTHLDSYQYTQKTYEEYNLKTKSFHTYQLWQCTVCKEYDYREVDSSGTYTTTCSKNGKAHTWCEWARGTGSNYLGIICSTCHQKFNTTAAWHSHRNLQHSGCFTYAPTLYYKICTTCGARVYSDKFYDYPFNKWNPVS